MAQNQTPGNTGAPGAPPSKQRAANGPNYTPTQRAQIDQSMAQQNAVATQRRQQNPGSFGYSSQQLADLQSLGAGAPTAATRAEGQAVDAYQQQVAAGQAPGSPTGAPTYQQAINTQFGQGNPFGQREWYGGNPLQTAQDLAQRNLDKNLAAIRARYGASGLGNSSRAALAEGEALAGFGTGLGDILAQRGEGAFQNDAARGLQAFLGALQGQMGLNSQALQANQQLGGFGTGLTGLGAQEQAIPNIGEILAALGAFQSISGSGGNRSRGASGFGFKS